MQDTRFDPWVSKIPWRREWQPIPVFLPRESHGQRSLACCSPWGHKESDATEQLNWTDWTADGVIRKRGELANSNREVNGTSLQYSCLESPVDRGAWWAAVHGVTKSRTRLSDFTFTFHFHALKKEMATHSSVLAWRIPGTVEPGRLPSMGSHRVGHDKRLSSSSKLKNHRICEN